jgi:CRP-like cAMP-binding protein
MTSGTLGRVYNDGEVLVRQGDPGDCLYVIQEGTVDILRETDGRETFLRTAGPGELIGEMAVFEKAKRSATVRARGNVRALTVDRKNFLKRVHEDPSIAYRVVQTLSRRVRELSERLVETEANLPSTESEGGGSPGDLH